MPLTTLHHTVSPEESGKTLAAILRSQLPGTSWNEVRQLLQARRVLVLGEVCLDEARRLKPGDTLELTAQSAPPPRKLETITLRYVDEHVVVVEKPAGMSTVRHPTERAWSAERKMRSPTLEDVVPKLLAQQVGRPRKGVLPRLRVVQRLDKETSGLIVFARTVLAESELGKQFQKHTVLRRYLALVPGVVTAQTIVSHLVRDRGDGRRGSTTFLEQGKRAVTHIEVVELLPKHTLIACRLETGRTHQIRIHLAELGHPLCGEKVYQRQSDSEPTPDKSGAPRLALHAAELGFLHPVSGQELRWEMPFPRDLADLLHKLRAQRKQE